MPRPARQSTENQIGTIERLEVYAGGTNDFAYIYNDGVTAFQLRQQASGLTIEGLANQPTVSIF